MKYEIFGIKIDRVNMNSVVHKICSYFNDKDKRIIFYINAYSLNLSKRDNLLKKAINKGHLVYCGGLGPVVAAKLIDNVNLTKTTTPDFINEIFSYMEKKNKSVFFLGGKDEDLPSLITTLKKKFPNLKIAGYNNGYFSNNRQILFKINKARPDLLLVGMGSPKQEKWIINNYRKVNARIFWSVGAVFEVLSGKFKRLPKVFNDYGLEWVFRFIQEPRRLGERYLIGNFKYINNLINEYFIKHNK